MPFSAIVTIIIITSGAWEGGQWSTSVSRCWSSSSSSSSSSPPPPPPPFPSSSLLLLLRLLLIILLLLRPPPPPLPPPPPPLLLLLLLLFLLLLLLRPPPPPLLLLLLLLLLRSPAISLGFAVFGEFFFAYVTLFFNLTIEVVTFRLRGWCMLSVFLLLAFTCLGHGCQDLLSPCDGMHVCTD